MAITVDEIILNGTYTKICTLASSVVAADQTAAITFVGAGMTNLAEAPIEWQITDGAPNAGALVATNWTISAASTTGFTANRVNAANTSAAALVTLRTIHSIDR